MMPSSLPALAIRIVRIVRIVATAAAYALPAFTGTAADDPWRPYRIEIGRQCPAKHLEWLSPADLRDVLETYEASAAPGTLAAMSVAEAGRCATTMAGATCGNLAEIDAVRSARELPAFAKSVCAAFVECHGQSDCIAAEPPTTAPKH
ncbi:hypothetical protein [Sphingomonas sp. Leaf198]|uniref:hypothetical protein n=2 Tax=unclassified Sphingomonas TaxID=196159 RepID=UPI0006F3848D|nr:hypothetical protein [Sphingomonas sp. Leaf198]KQS49243.1 hypothetical protein ASG20_09400 [Sphingomonas sp. Leaf198]